MAITFHVDIVSAESEIFSGIAEMVFAPGVRGELGIMPRHTPLLTPLKAGSVRVQLPGGKQEHYYVSGGILEIQPHVVTVLSDSGMRAHDIDESLAMEAKERAEALLEGQTSEMEYATAEKELAQAVAQLRVLERHRRR
ncbi:MAG: F0F1 ATP synthase subunit epsilon [Gammaproteobacteria bacterium]|nr:F0F1 ATP synthase subunit epsilon [Gammaproteobacteria bacterium]